MSTPNEPKNTSIVDLKKEVKPLEVEKEAKEEIEALHRLAARGIAHAECELGLCYEKGDRVTKDLNKALNFYHSAAAKGNARGQYHYGAWCLCLGDSDKGLDYLKKAAEQEFVKAYLAIGKYYESKGDGGFNLDINQLEKGKCYRTAVAWYKKAAKQGNGKAQFFIDKCHQKGIGLTKQDKQVLWHLQSPANKRNEQQKNSLAIEDIPLTFGADSPFGFEITPQIYEKALKNDAEAQFQLGIVYRNGYEYRQGTFIKTDIPNFEESRKWHEKAAANGNLFSEYTLATYEINGLASFRKNPKAGWEKVKQVSSKGLGLASFDYAHNLYNEFVNFPAGVDSKIKSDTLKEIVLYVDRARSQPHSSAKLYTLLGLLHFTEDFYLENEKIGFKKDRALALRYLDRGYQMGDPLAKKLVESMSRAGQIEKSKPRPK